MIFGSIRASLVRWLRPPATSVPPRIEPLPPWPWVDPHQRGAEPEPIGSTLVRVVAAKPPPDPAVDRPWRWSEWVRERERFGITGWIYCRFPIRFPEDRAVFVFGAARGAFGIYPTSFMVHYVGTASAVEHILPCLVQMRTGLGVGLFGGLDAAVMAAALAEKMADWNVVDTEDEAAWTPVRDRVHAAWADMGIIPATNAYATTKRSTEPWLIYGLSPEAVMAGKPARPS